METLDVGCGDVPNGNVNVDLFFYTRSENLVISDAHFLPFKDNVFEKVHCKHCLEHLENPLKFFKEAFRILKKGGVLECVYPTDTLLTKKTIHNLINLRWSSAFKWKQKLTGGGKINYGGHKWQLPNDKVCKLLRRAGFEEVRFYKIRFPFIRVDLDDKEAKWIKSINRCLPKWQIETRFVARYGGSEATNPR